MYVATVARGSNVKNTRAFRLKGIRLLRQIILLPVCARRAPTLAQTIRANEWWETGAPGTRARSRMRFACVIGVNPAQSIH
jgi:hypothetical protein